MPRTIDDLETPVLLIDLPRLDWNIAGMQRVCDAAGIELWPHIKTHKMVPVGRRQLTAGARGFTCAKLGEAEVMLATGVTRIFVAHSLVDRRSAPRLRALADGLAELILAVTSPSQAGALDRVLELAGMDAAVMMAVDTGLGREGVRHLQQASELAAAVHRSAHLRLAGVYTHEGHAYSLPGEIEAAASAAAEKLRRVRDALDPRLRLWPGCTATAAAMARQPGINAIRPGAYVFGDLLLTRATGAMEWNAVALSILCTVVDLPEAGLALIDAGSKTFSSDKLPTGEFARALDGRDLAVVRCSEEHGFVRGADAASLRIGDRLRFVPAHVCPAVNLANSVVVVEENRLVDTWKVDARGNV